MRTAIIWEELSWKKTLYTIENSIGFDFDTGYVRDVAGPFDSSIYDCEGIVSRKNKWFVIDETGRGVSYNTTEKKDTYKKYYMKYFSEYDAEIQRIIVIIPGLFEPPVRTLRATIPENESHIFR